jgi:hypothetical protein
MYEVKLNANTGADNAFLLLETMETTFCKFKNLFQNSLDTHLTILSHCLFSLLQRTSERGKNALFDAEEEI